MNAKRQHAYSWALTKTRSPQRMHPPQLALCPCVPVSLSLGPAAAPRRQEEPPPGLEQPGDCGPKETGPHGETQRPWTGTSGEGARRRPPGLEHPGGQPTANDWNNRSVAKKQDGGPLDWNIRGAVETRNAAPWNGASGGMRTDALDWNIRGRSR